MSHEKHDYYTISESKYGFGYSVYGWGRYPLGSVLAGQARKSFLDEFDTIEEAQDAYPDARVSSPLMEPQVSLNHLPDDGDY